MTTTSDPDQLDLFGLPSKVDAPSLSPSEPVTSTIMAKKPTVAPREGRKQKSRGAAGGGAGSPPTNIYGGGDGSGGEDDTALATEARRRYLNYALSVITSRALPDVRDGLKPVQRRILYAMLADEHLRPEAKHRKSAKVVGSVLGKYHPHGDSSVYDAMVRMAQDFTLRLPLVDGSGNFGSLDGDTAAAYRYTECRLAPPAMELLRELEQKTVPFRANYDGTTVEPQVLPARFPNLLVNGSTGIAVGMATNIPPHNLGEVVDAAIALIGDRNLHITNLMKFIQGPDFPTGGQILNTKPELREIYENGQGAIRVRGEYKLEEKKRGGTDIVITSIPWAMTKASLVEKIAEVILSRKLPFLLDVRDESTTDVRIVMEIKRDADPAVVMAYLYKQTPLQQNFNLNITCLVPANGDDEEDERKADDDGDGDDGANPEPPCQPMRLGLKDVLLHFLDFRLKVVRKRFRHELRQLEKRIHVLEGFAKIFDALDETIKIIRASDGKTDAAGKLMKRFGLDDLQVEAILELKLYKLAKLEIKIIREELATKEAEAKRIRTILKSESKLWDVVKVELEEVAKLHGSKRRTKTGGAAEEIEVSEDAFIVDEDAHVVVTRDNWIKRVRELKDPTATRTREGDEVMAVLPGSTKEKVVFFTNRGSAYVVKINDIAATTGYGDPAQKYFKFGDGERIVAAMSFDPRVSGPAGPAAVPETLLAVSKNGYGLRFATAGQTEVTTKAGRRYARPGEGDEIVGVVGVKDSDVVVAATQKGHVLQCKAEEITKLEGPGRGVTVIKTADDDHVIGFVAGDKGTVLAIENAAGKDFSQKADPKQTSGRGGKGHQLQKRTTFAMVKTPVVIPSLGAASTTEGNK